MPRFESREDLIQNPRAGKVRPRLIYGFVALDMLIAVALVLAQAYTSNWTWTHVTLFRTYWLGDSIVDLVVLVPVRAIVMVIATIAISVSAPIQYENTLGDINGEDDGDRESESSEVPLGDWQKRRKKIYNWAVLAFGISLSTFGSVKCLARLIGGTPADGGVGNGWYWSMISEGAVLLLLEMWAVSRYVGKLNEFEGDTEEVQAGSPMSVESPLDDERFPLISKKKKKMPASELVKLLAKESGKEWAILLLAFVCLVFGALGETLLPYFIGKSIDAIALEKNKETFYEYVVLLLITGLVTSVFSGLRGACFIVAGGRFSIRLRQNLFQSLLDQEVAFYDVNKTGELTSRLTADCEKVSDQVQLNVNVFIRNTLQALLTLVFMFYINWKLMLMAFVSIPTVTIASKVFGRYMEKLSKESRNTLAKANNCATENLSSVRTIKSFAAEHSETYRYEVALQSYLTVNDRLAFVYFWYGATTFTFLPQMTAVLVLFYGGQLLQQGEIQSSAMISFVFYMQSLFSAFNSMGTIYTNLVQAMGAADKVFEWTYRQPEIQSPPNPKRPVDCNGDITFQDIYFTYPTRKKDPILKGLSVRAKPGEVLALCGPSGGGKSSVMALLQNFYTPCGGEIRLDDVPISELDRHWLHKQVAFVSQEPVLYARTIKENILFGLETSDEIRANTKKEKKDDVQTDFQQMQTVMEAAKLANAHDFIMTFPKGYQTQVGEKGSKLSGGQKQRIAIARALVRRPRVLLLDEATSALDAESEATVQEAIDRMIAAGGMTVIVIAHRLSTIKNAHQIAVIEGGRIVEQGTHDDLVKKGGSYSNLVTKQLQGSPSTTDLAASTEDV